MKNMKFKLLLIIILASISVYEQDSKADCFLKYKSDSILKCQKDSTLSLLFIGDVMGHKSQIKAAYNKKTKQYHYTNVFKHVSPIFKSVDYTIANLEVTLAGKPYNGYPAFSSPDALVTACKSSGINILTTANNHSCDRGKRGLLRTIKVLDSLKIPHTGTFRNTEERKNKNLLIIEKNNIKVGILNYTYGTNGIKVRKPTIVNLIDTAIISKDIKDSKIQNLDKLIVSIHWGIEYKTTPNKNQKDLAKFMFNKGVDIIIGSHPHVLQRMEYHPEKINEKEKLIVYSLGNFVSNQRTSPRDGGAMLKFTLKKENNKTSISDCGYYLTWVNKPKIEGKTTFEVLPCYKYELDSLPRISKFSQKKMKIYINKSRKLYKEQNINIKEIIK